MYKNYFYSTIFGFLGGVFVAYFSGISSEAFGALAVVSVSLCAFLILLWKRRFASIEHRALALFVFIIFLAIGGIRMNLKATALQNQEREVESFLNRDVKIVGVAEGDYSASDSKAVLSLRAIHDEDGDHKINSIKIIVNNGNTDLNFGDWVEYEGKLSPPKSTSDFDYVSYLRKDGILYEMDYPRLIGREKGGTSISTFLHSIKRGFEKNIESILPEPESALANGVTISGKGALPADVKEDFIKAGVIHIVVLSGYNIAVVIAFILALFGFIGRRKRYTLALLAVFAFVVMSGGSAPVVRSAIMASIATLGALLYTPIIQNRALFATAFLMTLWNPLLLISDASFALSFLSTFAIVNFTKYAESFFHFATDRFGIKKILAETFATQFFVLPYILYEIGRLSVIAPLSNLFILPLIPFIMLLCFVCGVLSFIPFIALPIGFLLYVLSFLVVKFAHIFSSLPFSSFNFKIPFFVMLLMYLAIFLFVYFKRKKATEVAYTLF